MLGKLLKHEFKNTAKLMLTIYAMFLVITVIGAITLSNDSIAQGTSDIAQYLNTIIITFYSLSVFALYIITFVYMCFHFYKTMFSDQGYLTHTLPVKTASIFHVKLFVSIVWMVCSTLLLVASVFLLITGATGENIFQITTTNWNDLQASFMADTGISFLHFLLYACISVLLTTTYALLWIFTSMAIGQLFHQAKAAASVAAGIILYFINQILSTVVAFVSGYPKFLFTAAASSSTATAGTFSSTFSPMFTSSMIFSLIVVIIYYIVCRIILEKHINLD